MSASGHRGARSAARGARRLGDLGAALVDEIDGAPRRPATLDVHAQPAVILVVGVNGTGKTTTIGKLAVQLREHGRPVVVGAADTFRAAAEEQLEIWARARRCRLRRRASAAATRRRSRTTRSRRRGRAGATSSSSTRPGRLHTQPNLMEELAKVRRVIERKLEGAPHETLLVVDATTGQNGLQQARLFGEAVGVTGVALTKLDGSAKGGIAVAIAHELGLPVKLVGVGEQLDDLRPFDPQDFARALVAGLNVATQALRRCRHAAPAARRLDASLDRAIATRPRLQAVSARRRRRSLAHPSGGSSRHEARGGPADVVAIGWRRPTQTR